MSGCGYLVPAPNILVASTSINDTLARRLPRTISIQHRRVVEFHGHAHQSFADADNGCAAARITRSGIGHYAL
jgi:hypothetical protein